LAYPQQQRQPKFSGEDAEKRNIDEEYILFESRARLATFIFFNRIPEPRTVVERHGKRIRLVQRTNKNDLVPKEFVKDLSLIFSFSLIL
jgi:hypothetical protein